MFIFYLLQLDHTFHFVCMRFRISSYEFDVDSFLHLLLFSVQFYCLPLIMPWWIKKFYSPLQAPSAITHVCLELQSMQQIMYKSPRLGTNYNIHKYADRLSRTLGVIFENLFCSVEVERGERRISWSNFKMSSFWYPVVRQLT